MRYAMEELPLSESVEEDQNEISFEAPLKVHSFNCVDVGYNRGHRRDRKPQPISLR